MMSATTSAEAPPPVSARKELPAVSGGGAGNLSRRQTLSRMAALGVVAGLAVIGPVLEGALGGGRGFAIGFLVMVLAPSLVRAGGPRFHPLDPETFVPIMYFLSAGYAPCLHLVTSKYLELSYAEQAAFQVAYVGAVGCSLLCSGLSRPPKRTQDQGWGLANRVLPRDWAVMATGLAGALLVGIWVATTGVSALFNASYAETYQQEDGKGVLISGWYFIQLAIVHCVARATDFRRAGKKVPRVLLVAIAFMMLAFLFNTILGRRGPLIWMAMSVALCLHVSGMQVRRLWLVVGAVLTLIYAFAVEGYRTELGQGAAAQLEAARAGLERVDNPFVVQELEGVFANLTTVVEQDPPILHYPGESWVNAFLILIPKPIWRDRPTALSQRYVWWASPSFAREGGGYAFNATAEGYLNLGLLGAFLQIAGFSFLFFFFPTALCVAKPQDPLFRALAACLTSFSYNQFRGEFASMLKIAVAFVLAAAFIHLTSAVFHQVREQFAQYTPKDFRARLADGGARHGERAEGRRQATQGPETQGGTS